jgi:hypothetical protein
VLTNAPKIAFDKFTKHKKNAIEILATNGSDEEILDAISDIEYLLETISDIVAEMYLDSYRPVSMELLSRAAANERPLLFMEWDGEGVIPDYLLFTEKEIFYLAGPVTNSTVKKIVMNENIAQAVNKFCRMPAILASKGIAERFSNDAPVFFYTIFGDAASVINTCLFYSLDEEDAEKNADAAAVVDLKAVINKFLRKNGVKVNVYASGA